ncbi:MAG: hypothetical protein J0H55_05515 [Chitinophagaceae bacterium]|nr:hypothetical protein [Chitinophagaceae bacterium]
MEIMKPNDRRFVEYWQDQKKGSRAGYYLTYTLGWSIVGFFVLFFFSKLFTNLWETGGESLVYIFAIISIVSAFIITHFTYRRNEKRLHRIVEKHQEELN